MDSLVSIKLKEQGRCCQSLSVQPSAKESKLFKRIRFSIHQSYLMALELKPKSQSYKIRSDLELEAQKFSLECESMQPACNVRHFDCSDH